MRELKRGVLVHYVRLDATHQSGLITQVLQDENIHVQLDNPSASYGREEMTSVPHDEVAKLPSTWHFPE